MTATEQWIFLCAAHKNPKEVCFISYDIFMMYTHQCSAIDYTLHTLHGAASLLNSNKHFPSRSASHDVMDYIMWCHRLCIKESSLSKLSSVARRIYRIFSHAYFHHRRLYEEFEVSYSIMMWSHEMLQIGRDIFVSAFHSLCHRVQIDVTREPQCSHQWYG